MKDKLVKFYHDCLLPELFDPLYHTEGHSIRNPQYMLDAHEKNEEKKAEAKALRESAATAPKKRAAPVQKKTCGVVNPKKTAAPATKKCATSKNAKKKLINNEVQNFLVIYAKYKPSSIISL